MSEITTSVSRLVLATLVEFNRTEKPEDGTTLASRGWSEGTGGCYVRLECNGCGALWVWGYNRDNRWLPDRRHLNHCPGCGKTITGVEIPVGGTP